MASSEDGAPVLDPGAALSSSGAAGILEGASTNGAATPFDKAVNGAATVSGPAADKRTTFSGPDRGTG